MSQQIAIMLLIDIEGALNDGRLDENIYMFDNLKTEGSEGEGTGDLITSANGYKWYDGSQASEVVFNWLISGVGTLPRTLPAQYLKTRRSRHNKEVLSNVLDMKNAESVDKEKEAEALERIKNMSVSLSKVQDNFGNLRDFGIGTLTVTGKDYVKDNSDEPISYIDPIITDITGEAVDKGVIFPAQYGAPVPIKEGWYWSATTDTNKVGIYSYTLHITLFKPKDEKASILEWMPVPMTWESKIKVNSNFKVNGFTNGAMSELPIYK